MPKSFEHWLDGAGRGETEEVDDTITLRCYGCGREEYVSLAELEAGNVGWWVEASRTKPVIEPGDVVGGRCGGSQFCLP